MENLKNIIHNKLFALTVSNMLFYSLSLSALVALSYSKISFLIGLILFFLCQFFLLNYFSSKPSNIWKQLAENKVLTCSLLLALARTGLTLLHCFTRSAGSLYASMGVTLSFLILYGISEFYFLLRESKISFARLFVIQAFVFGIVLLLIFPIYSIADEPQHIRTAYNLSNIYMGIEKPDEGMLMRKDDFEFESKYLDYVDYTVDDFNQYLSDLSEPLHDSSLILVKDDMEFSPTLAYNRRPLVFNTEWYQYTFSALGITLGRLCNMNTLLTYSIGRFFNLLFYIIAVYCAIRIIPIGKSLLYSISLLPMPMQLAASASRDTFRIACALLLVSLTLRYFYPMKKSEAALTDKTNIKSETVLNDTLTLFSLIVTSILLFPLRSYIYSTLILLPLGIFSWRKGILNKKRLLILILIPVLLICSYIVFKQFIHPENIIDEPKIGLIWYSGQRYSKEYFINHPLSLISIIQHTFWINAAWYVETMIGYWLGWLNVNYSEILVYLLLICLVINSVKRSYEPQNLPLLFRLSSGALSFLSMVLIMIGMAVTWTELGNTVIDGVQGRYFLPILFPFLLSFRGSSITADEKMDKVAIYIQFVTTLYIVQFLLLRMFG